MSRSGKFSKDLAKALGQRMPSHCWSTEWKPVTGSRESVDVVGFPANASESQDIVLIEVELRRADPASNVIKIWQSIKNKGLPTARTSRTKNAVPKRLVLFQAFSKVYRLQKRPNMRKKANDAQFIGELFEKLNKQVRYEPIQFEYHPYKGANQGGGARKKAAHKLSDRIFTRWRKICTENRGAESKST